MEIERLVDTVEDLQEEIDTLSAWQLGFEPPSEVKDAISRMTEIQVRLGILEAELERLRKE